MSSWWVRITAVKPVKTGLFYNGIPSLSSHHGTFRGLDNRDTIQIDLLRRKAAQNGIFPSLAILFL